MAKQKLDAEDRKNILKARKWIEDISKKDANEAETRARIHDIFGMLMGYDRHKHIKLEDQIRGAGEPKRCDLAIQVNSEESPKPDFLVEVKRVNMKLTLKHLGQAVSYAINIGCEWVLLTNGIVWKLYHVHFSKPPQTKEIESWNLNENKPVTLAEKFGLICYKNIKKDGLKKLLDISEVLTPQNLLKIILSGQSIRSIRSKLKKENQVTVSPEDIVDAIHRMLNESALGEITNVKTSPPVKKQRSTTSFRRSEVQEEKKQEPEAQNS